jgi:hypothetical protein
MERTLPHRIAPSEEDKLHQNLQLTSVSKLMRGTRYRLCYTACVPQFSPLLVGFITCLLAAGVVMRVLRRRRRRYTSDRREWWAG